VRADVDMQRAADLGRRHGGIMPIRRVIIIPAILALSAAGSILTGSAVSATAAQAPSVHVVAAAHAASPHTYFWG